MVWWCNFSRVWVIHGEEPPGAHSLAATDSLLPLPCAPLLCVRVLALLLAQCSMLLMIMCHLEQPVNTANYLELDGVSFSIGVAVALFSWRFHHFLLCEAFCGGGIASNLVTRK